MFRLKFLTVALVAAVAVLTSPALGQAAFLLRLDSGSTSATIDLATGEVLATSGASGFTAGSFLATTNSGTGSGNYAAFTSGAALAGFLDLRFAGYQIFTQTNLNNEPGNDVFGNLYLGNTQVKNTTTGALADLKLSVTNTDYQLPSAVNRYVETTFNATVTVSSATVDLYSYYADGTTAFDTASNVNGEDLHVQATSTMPASSTIATSPSFAATGPYTLTDVVLISGLTNGQVATASVDQVVRAPAPTGLIMAVTAVPFFGLLRRRLRKTAALTA